MPRKRIHRAGTVSWKRASFDKWPLYSEGLTRSRTQRTACVMHAVYRRRSYTPGAVVSQRSHRSRRRRRRRRPSWRWRLEDAAPLRCLSCCRLSVPRPLCVRQRAEYLTAPTHWCQNGSMLSCGPLPLLIEMKDQDFIIHTRTHARTHARTHTHLYMLILVKYQFNNCNSNSM